MIGDERATDTDKNSVAGMPLPSAAVLSLFESTLSWPRNSAASFSTAINKQNILAIETLVRFGGKSGSNAFVPQIMTSLTKYADREAQCLAAELVSGLVRASVSLDSTTRKDLQLQLQQGLSSALANFTSDTCSDWMEALRFCVCNRDPRRFHWLSKTVVSIAPSLETPSTVVLNCLKLQQALLIEFGWKGYSFASEVVDRLYSFLGGASKSVREEAARGLVSLSLIDACLPTSLSLLRCNIEQPGSRVVLCSRFPEVCKRLLDGYYLQSKVSPVTVPCVL